MANASETVGVIGAGVIGIGVAQSLAVSGRRVTLVDVAEDRLDAARQRLFDNLRASRLLQRDPSREPAETVLERIDLTTSFDGLDRANFIIENVTERWATKKPVYQKLDEVCLSECIFAANTSAIPITHIASVTTRPDRVVGVHFMNPVPAKRAVEVIQGHHTSGETLQSTLALLGQMGKQAIVVKDGPGFVTNRILMLTINEAIFVLQERIATAMDVDRIFKDCFNHVMGPLETADLIGLDTILDTLEVLCEFTHDQKFRPSSLLRKMVAAGLCGRKSGEGFYRYA
jgi:3-hydroxybutyryl-CoA dehydrogenase